MSSLFSTIQRGLSYSAASYFFSSPTIALRLRDRIDVLVERRQVDQVQQQAGALQMAQELMAEPGPSAAPSMSPGMSATTKLCSGADAHDAEVRVQRREGIVGDLGTCIGDGRDQRRLAGIGHAQQADVGQHLQFELQACSSRPASPASSAAARGWCCS